MAVNFTSGAAMMNRYVVFCSNRRLMLNNTAMQGYDIEGSVEGFHAHGRKMGWDSSKSGSEEK